MRKAKVYNHSQLAGWLIQLDGDTYEFEYFRDYNGPPISLTMPTSKKRYQFPCFPPFFDGLLPEGLMLEALLKRAKIDRHDYFQQLICVGADLVGSVTVIDDEALPDHL